MTDFEHRWRNYASDMHVSMDRIAADLQMMRCLPAFRGFDFAARGFPEVRLAKLRAEMAELLNDFDLTIQAMEAVKAAREHPVS